MATVTLEGKEVHTNGNLPKVGSQAPSFKLTMGDLSEVTLHDYPGKKLLLNIVPSLDTGTCAASTRRFNASFEDRDDAIALTVSADLPFALARFCGAEGLENVIPLSIFRAPDFGKDYGATITSGPLSGLLSRAVVIVDKSGNVAYTEQVPEIAQEPDYEAALKVLSEL